MTDAIPTRREAIGRLIRVTLTTTAIPQILLVQTTFAQGTAATLKDSTQTRPAESKDLLKPPEGERVVVSAEGSVIAFTIVGAPGRRCRVSYAAEGSDDYTTVLGGTGTIGRRGQLKLSIDVRRFGDRRLLFGVRTSQSETSDEGVRATTPIEVTVKDGAVLALSGVRERGTIGLSAAGVCKAVVGVCGTGAR